ncbi:MAG: carboxypeptidase regulatory-like domain-containing protein [Planctomycetes bacterium]|nr:carboxypeptidase regulatory-like domain-containing protein [Planctomycetota bacterium]
MLRTMCGSLLAACVLLAAGCGKGGGTVARGTVIMNGQPLAGAVVQFVPKSDGSLGAHTVNTGPDGTFTLRTESPNTPVKPGSYVIVVNKWRTGEPGKGSMDAMKSEIPDRYRTQATTPLKAELKDGENALEPLHINTKSMQPGSSPGTQVSMR